MGQNFSISSLSNVLIRFLFSFFFFFFLASTLPHDFRNYSVCCYLKQVSRVLVGNHVISLNLHVTFVKSPFNFRHSFCLGICEILRSTFRPVFKFVTSFLSSFPIFHFFFLLLFLTLFSSSPFFRCELHSVNLLHNSL